MFEKVNPQHPDKVADRIAGAIVDLAYTKNERPKIAVEVLLGHGEAKVIIESSEEFRKNEIQDIVNRITGGMQLDILSVNQDSHLACNQELKIRCGDNGIFKGSPTTREQILLCEIASDIYNQFPYDGKYILSKKDSTLHVTICQSHMKAVDETLLRKYITNYYNIDSVLINPIGPWLGGLNVDSGATNRKLGSDMGDGVTGGGLHGKDLSKADVSVNIWCFLQSFKTKRPVEAFCSIGDESVNNIPYWMIVNKAKEFIDKIGGFEKFAEWGLIRPQGI